jgi:hypothetical protein
MADTKITALTALTAADPANDVIPIVDVSDTTMAASGTTKKISVNNILSSSPTASGALTVTGLVTAGSATITGDLTVDTSTLKVDSTNNRVIVGHTSGSAAFQVTNAGAAGLEIQPTGFSSSPLIQSYNRSGSAYTQLTLDASTIVHALSGSTAMTLNSTGLGIGAVPSNYRLYVSAAFASGLNGAYIESGEYDKKSLVVNHTNASVAVNLFEVQKVGTALLTLDATGNLLVGLTVDTFAPAKGVSMFAGNSSRVAVGHANGTTSGDYYHSFAYNSTVIGSITQNGTTGVLFNTSSDYRLKDSVKPLSGGLARVNALKPSSYNWKSDGSTGEGFLAHELAEVVPFAVSGEKDAVNADGSIKSQGIDMSRVVPILVAAIQELTAEVNALKNA